MAEPLLARIVRLGGTRLFNRTVDRLLPKLSPKLIRATPASKSKTSLTPKTSVTGAIAGAALTRIASRSVPGALIVGGGLLAKSLYDRRRARKIAPEKDDDAGV